MDNLEKLDTIKELLQHIDFDDAVEIVAEMDNETDDFEISNYRFINNDDIDQIMQDELSDDTYMLGCFNDWFIADIIGISLSAVEKMQKAEAFDALGELMQEHIEEVQENYAQADGYGHHFASYDGDETEIANYRMFKIN